MNTEYRDFLYFLKWFEDEFKELSNKEQSLYVEPDADLEEAGIEKMSMFGEINIIDGLAGGDILKWKAVQDMIYEEVFVKLLKNKTENEIRENLDIIRKRKINSKN